MRQSANRRGAAWSASRQTAASLPGRVAQASIQMPIGFPKPVATLVAPVVDNTEVIDALIRLLANRIRLENISDWEGTLNRVLRELEDKVYGGE